MNTEGLDSILVRNSHVANTRIIHYGPDSCLGHTLPYKKNIALPLQ